MRLEERERIVLETLQKIPRDDVVLVGGYAINAYVPPRFSIDCDLVVLGHLGSIEAVLKAAGFVRAAEGDVPYGSYLRYIRSQEGVSFDLLVGSVHDRETRIAFETALFAERSKPRVTAGRVHPIRLEARIADPELLFAMKFVAGRRQDIRDLFMLAGLDLDREGVRGLISEKCGPALVAERVAGIRRTTGEPSYRDSLQGAYGKIPDGRFEKCKAQLEELLRSLA